MKILSARASGRLKRLLVTALGIGAFVLLILRTPAAAADDLSPRAVAQIYALRQEKESRTPAQQKMDSQLVYAVKRGRNEVIAPGVTNLQIGVKFAPDGRVPVDVTATVTPALLSRIQQSGGQIINSFPQFHAIRALVPLAQAEVIAGDADVKFIQPAVEAYTSTGLLNSEGDTTHAADLARTVFRVNGGGVKVGVLSDSVDFLANSQATGDLPPNVTILPGQGGNGAGEGTAMLEIIYDLAPGAQLFFATAFNGPASFAQNILNLRAAGCDVIADDVFYFNESPFQDGIIAQAVNTVTEDGALFFSSAGNSGNFNDGTSGTWQGDFVDGGAAGPPVNGKNGNIHSFGATTYDTVNGPGFAIVLFWSDPLGSSTNDYDLYVLDATGANIVSSSTTVQNGAQDPFEIVPSPATGDRVVVVRASGDARFLHLDTIRGRLSISTSGNTKGHAAATNAYCVAAVDVATAFPRSFIGGAANPVEFFSSDGPRRVFYNADGTAITPGNFSSTGGAVRQKPDIAAADGVMTTVPGFNPFFGTSAAAPHAAAIAALIKSYNPALTPVEMRTALTNSALDIEVPGIDQDAGGGIIMALQAIAITPLPVPKPNLILVTNVVYGGNGNGVIDTNECHSMDLILTNAGSAEATSIQATLSTATPGVIVAQRTATYTNMPPGGPLATNQPAFRISIMPTFICGTPIDFTLVIKSDQQTVTNNFRVQTGTLGPPIRFDNFNGYRIPDNNPVGTNSPIVVSNFNSAVAKVTVALHITHTFDADLRLQLVSPDGITNTLSANRGGSGNNYGAGCADNFRTVFDDGASNSIATAFSPFIGVFKPELPLSAFVGKSGTNVNGTWQLRVVDEFAIDIGAIQCWSLYLSPAVCEDGGGQCPGVDVAVGMTASPNPVFIGSNLVYTITVTNNGPNIAKNVVMSQDLPNNVVFVSATSSQGNVSHSGGTVTANLGTMNPTATATITVIVLPTLPGMISSTATVVTSDTDVNPSNNSVTVTSRVNEPLTDLAIGMIGTPNPVLNGASLTYTVTVTNNGPSVASRVFATNMLPNGVAVVSPPVSSQGSVLNLGDQIVWTIGTLTNSARATMTIDAVPVVEGPITASARVSGDQTDPLPLNNMAISSVIVGPAADLVVGLVANPTTAVVRSNVTYAISVTNLGPSTASGVAVNDTLPAGVTLVSSNTTQGTFSLSGNTVLCNVGSLTPGAGALITLVINPTNVGTIQTTASASASQPDSNPANNSASANVLVAPPFVSIVAAGATLTNESILPPNGAVDPGETVTVQFRLRNAGNVVNANLVATLLATGGVTAPSAPQSYGVLPAGGLPIAEPFTFTAGGANGGTVTATLQLQDGPNNLGAVSFNFVLPSVTLRTNANAIDIPDNTLASPYPSTIDVSGLTNLISKVTATLVNMNHTYPHDVSVLLVGPAGQKVTLMSHAGAGGGGLANGTLTFDSAATNGLPESGQLVSGTFLPTEYNPAAVFSSPAPARPYLNSLSVFNGPNPNGAWSLYVVDDEAGDFGNIAQGWRLAFTSVVPVNQIADLAMSGAGAPAGALVGQNITYTFNVTNNGPNAATSVAFTNQLPAALALVSVNPSQGATLTAGNSVLCNLGSLAAGSGARVTVVATLQAPGSLTNIASVYSSETDLNPANNTATIVSAINLPQADVAMAASAAPEPAVVGSNLLYTITVTNLGPQTALNVALSTPLPAGLEFASATSTVGSSTNLGSVVITSLGSLAPGANATATITAIGQAAATITNTISASTASSDANAANNSTNLITTIENPAPKIRPAGATLLSENFAPHNGTLDNGETVTVSLTLTNAGSANAANLVATLQSSGGVISLSAPQTNSSLAPGSAVALSFRFTHDPESGPAGTVIATLALQDDANDLDTNSVTFTFNLPGTTSFANAAAITIPESGSALAYPSTINVSGLTGLVDKVTVTLSNINHRFPHDVNVLLVSPAGRSVVLMSHAGGGHSLTNKTLTFDDTSLVLLPAASSISNGTFKPTAYLPNAAFPPPAPGGSHGSTLASLNGISPIGPWSLYVVDDSAGDGGNILNGWGVNITTVNTVNPAADLSIAITAAPDPIFTQSLLTYSITVANGGPADVSGVVVSNALPPGMLFNSAVLSQGSYSETNGVVTFDLGDLAAGAQASVALRTVPTSAGVAVNNVTVTSQGADLNQANNSAQVSTVVLNLLPARLEGFSVLTNGQFQLTLNGQAVRTYIIQASADLTTWVPVSTNVTAGNGTFKFTDLDAPNFQQRFYRAVRLP